MVTACGGLSVRRVATLSKEEPGLDLDGVSLSLLLDLYGLRGGETIGPLRPDPLGDLLLASMNRSKHWFLRTLCAQGLLEDGERRRLYAVIGRAAWIDPSMNLLLSRAAEEREFFHSETSGKDELRRESDLA
jgi:hypothetical protein